jgi:hypothetical protein
MVTGRLVVSLAGPSLCPVATVFVVVTSVSAPVPLGFARFVSFRG